MKGERERGAASFARDILRNKGYLVIFLFIWIVAAIFVNKFATLNNNINLLKQAAVPTISCIGVTFVLMTGGIDLSIGYTMGLCSFLYGFISCTKGLPVWLAVMASVAVGTVCGLVNGILVKKAKIPAFITTLGTGYIIYGLAQILSNGAATNWLPVHVLAVGRTVILGLQSMIWISAAIVLIGHFILHRSTYGRKLSGCGYNFNAVWLSGINADRTIVLAYAICGTLTAVSAVMMSCRTNVCTPALGGSGYTFEVITAALLGGASLGGGLGSALGAVFGTLTILIIQNCISLMGVHYYVYQAVLSIVILIAILFENIKNKYMQ